MGADCAAAPTTTTTTTPAAPTTSIHTVRGGAGRDQTLISIIALRRRNLEISWLTAAQRAEASFEAPAEAPAPP